MPAMQAPAPGKRAILATVAGIVAAAFVSVGLGSWWALANPARADWSDAATWIRARMADGDAVAILPYWADVGRLAFGEGPLLSVPRLEEEDLWRYRRLWVMAAPALTSGTGRALSGLAHRYLETADGAAHFGGVDVRLFALPDRPVRFDFVAGVDRAAVRVDRWVKGRAEPLVSCDRPLVVPGLPASKGWTCPAPAGRKRSHWMKVERRIHHMDDAPRECLTVHPWSKASVILSYAGVPMGRSLALEVGHQLTATRHIEEDDHVPTRVRVMVDGAELCLLEIDPRSTWERWRFDTTAFAAPGTTADVTFRIASSSIAWRFPCLAARTLEEPAESRSPPGSVTGAGGRP